MKALGEEAHKETMKAYLDYWCGVIDAILKCTCVYYRDIYILAYTIITSFPFKI